ncbi:MAG: AlpA family phage regulatory protein [Hyphomicrobiaceae bacterium]|nr:AlpA family phage regulatory protein [Hyphomicrobiaceae bacterium]
MPENNTTAAAPEGPTLLLIGAVQRRTDLPRSTIYLLIDRGEFPRPVRLTPRRVAWVASEIDAFIASKIAARDRAA